MPKSTPDHHDADLILKLYDLRREAVMRQSRNAMAAPCGPMPRAGRATPNACA